METDHVAAILNRFPDHLLWDYAEDIAFWVKDCSGRFVWVNDTFASRAGATRKHIIGTRDSDWFLNELASIYVGDDARVIASGQPLVNLVELVISPDGDISWHRTHKFPLINEHGQVIATFGSTRLMKQATHLPQVFADLARVIQLARDGLEEGVGVVQLAQRAGISVSTLERLVQRQLRITPRELLLRMRMNRARQLLITSTLAISAVAESSGYQSLSSFSRAFKACFGSRPGEFRHGLAETGSCKQAASG